MPRPHELRTQHLRTQHLRTQNPGFVRKGVPMPRWRDQCNARTIQISLSIRPEDRDQWLADAKAQKISLSRLIYVRARANGPLPSPGEMALAKELGRVGNNLNQLVKLLHSNGINPSAVAETLAVVWSIQERLVLR